MKNVRNDENILPFGLGIEEWQVFQDLISTQRALHPTLQSQKLIRKVVTAYRNIFPQTYLRTNKAQEYINELHSLDFFDRKIAEKKIYTDVDGKNWQYMNKDEIVSYFSSVQKRKQLRDTIFQEHGLIEGYAYFSRLENKSIKVSSHSSYKCLPQTYKTLLLICTGSQESLSAYQLSVIGFTQSMIHDILRPKRSRIIATKGQLLSSEVRNFFAVELIQAKKIGTEFRKALIYTIRRWNTSMSSKYGFTIPIQINPYKKGISLCGVLGINDASWKSILTALQIDKSVWEDGVPGNTNLNDISRILFLLQSMLPFSGTGKPTLFHQNSGISLTDFTFDNGIFRFTRTGLERYKGKYDYDFLQSSIEKLLLEV